MDQSTLRDRLRDDLRRQFRGDLLLDALSRSLYATDASLFQVEPLAVAVPRDEDDLRCLVRYAYERSLPLMPRGAGTGLAGEALGHGIVVDLSTHFRSILAHGDDWVRVEPGIVLAQLNRDLAARGRRFAPDPASARSCTIGGMIATNASGSRAALHGYTADHVRELRVVWDDGTAADVSPAIQINGERTVAIAKAIQELLRNNADLITAYRPRLRFNRCGYELGDPVRADLLRLLIGSEGTLAFTTAATLRTIPLAGGRAALALGCRSVEEAIETGLRARDFAPAACEVLDRRLASLARAQSAQAASIISAEVEAALLVEFEGDSPHEARAALTAFSAAIARVHEGVMPMFAAQCAEEADEMWTIRAAAVLALHALGKGRRPLAFVEDIGVSPDKLLDLYAGVRQILKEHEVTASFLVHVATGQVHVRPFLDPDDPGDAEKLWPLAERLHSFALELGGTISAQHGVGLARTPWVERQFGRLYPVFQEVKRLIDPRNILNPGKIVGPDPSRPAWPLRGHRTKTLAAGTSPRTATPLLLWEPEEMTRAVAACNGCGACRTEAPAQRMCPMFRALHSEAAAPRAKANLFRAMLDDQASEADELRGIADLCINCRMCATECPGKANIPKLMLEAKAANHAAHGLRRSTWFLARLDGLASWGGQFGLTTNFLLRRASIRWVMEKIFGLSRRRTLPAFTLRTFLRRSRRRGWNRRPDSGTRVAYFVDTFANVFDPSLAEATVAVLRHNGIAVHVPTRQSGSGAMALAQGDHDVARERLMANVRRLVEHARAGDTIVCSEPTAALFLRLDALGLVDDVDVRAVAEHTMELTAFLWSLHQQGLLRTDFQPLELSLGHHVPCHIKALGAGVHGPDLLSLIPGLRVSKIDVSCSGMAGPFGLNVKNYPISLMAGQPMLDEFARPEHRHGSSECSACRLQMQQATGKRALHPVQYLALGYGLMPSLGARLNRPFGGRVSS